MSYSVSRQYQDAPPIMFISTTNTHEGDFITERLVQNTNFIWIETHNSELAPHSRKERKKDGIIESLVSSNAINELIELSQNIAFRNAKTITRRLANLIELYDEEDISISIESLKTMLVFMASLPSMSSRPSLTLNEYGTFQASWKKDNKNLTTLRFKEGSGLDYVVFQESQHSVTPVILNGHMNVLDFIEYLQNLKLVRILEG